MSKLVFSKPRKLTSKSILWALVLRCPICGETPLIKKNHFLKFRQGCLQCNYEYEREPGYFWGQAMMISYPIIGMGLFVTGILLKTLLPNIGSYVFAAALSILAIPISILLNPHSRVCWMLLDLYCNPLNENDKIQ